MVKHQINLKDELTDCYCSEEYHQIDHNFAYTDGVDKLKKLLDNDQMFMLIWYYIKRHWDFIYPVIYPYIKITDNKLFVHIEEDIGGKLQRDYYIGELPIGKFADCEVRFECIHFVWLLLSEH